MSRFPHIFDEGRRAGVALVAGLAVGQAACAGIAAFATRDAFAAFGADGGEVPALALALIAAAGAGIAALRVAERAAAESIGQAFAASVRRTLFQHVTQMPMREVSQRRTGDLAIRFIGDLTAVRSWVSLGVARMISAAVIIPGAIVALALLNPLLAAAAAGPLLLSAVVMAALAPRLGPLHKQLRRQRARLAADMTERIPVAPELRLLGRDGLEAAKLDRSAASLRTAAVARTRTAAGLMAVPEIGAALAGVALLCTALLTGATAPEAAGALAILAILAVPLRDLAGVWDRHHAWAVARAKCQAVLDAPSLTCPATVRTELVPGPLRLDFEQSSAGPLRDLCATVTPGQCVAVVGANGSGKSTLLSLAAGFEAAESGVVALNGANIRYLPEDVRRAAVFYVGGRSPILKGSLRRALSLGLTPRPDDGTLEATARTYGLGGLLDRLHGLDGRIAEGGRNLSAGEARRVHLVRAALARPQLLLLDEPDDALDGPGRACVERLIRDCATTTLVVTHDLSLARRLDRLWYIDGGVVAASGRPDDVVDGGGPVTELFRPRAVA